MATGSPSRRRPVSDATYSGCETGIPTPGPSSSTSPATVATPCSRPTSEPGVDGEKRILVAASEIIGAYGKEPVDHRGNIDAGANAFAATLSEAEGTTVRRLVDKLDNFGVRFATIDLAGRYVLEINVANPGWLATYERITGVDLAPEVVQALSLRFIPSG